MPPKFTRSFITGSWAYSEPDLDHDPCPECNRNLPDTGSDVDLVVLVSKEDSGILAETCDYSDATKYTEGSKSLRFGTLNLICMITDKEFHEWKIATKALRQIADLRESGVVSRDEAVALVERVRDGARNRIDRSFEWIEYAARKKLTGEWK